MDHEQKRRKELEYGARAQAYAAAQNAGQKTQALLPTIKPGTAEWQAWERYFVNHLGFEPWAMTAARLGQIEKMTVPAQWPEWFDSEFSSIAA